MIKTRGLGIGQVCKDGSLGATVVRRWLALFEAEQLDYLFYRLDFEIRWALAFFDDSLSRSISTSRGVC